VTKNSPDQIWFQQYVEFTATTAAATRDSVRAAYVFRALPVATIPSPASALRRVFRRDYRLIFMPVKERLSEAVAKPPGSAIPPGRTRNVA